MVFTLTKHCHWSQYHYAHYTYSQALYLRMVKRPVVKHM